MLDEFSESVFGSVGGQIERRICSDETHLKEKNWTTTTS